MTTSGPEFLICLGAQKTGTSFLANYLRAHPQCSLTPIKEVHFFDRLRDMTPAEVAKVLRTQIDGFKSDLGKTSILKRRNRGLIKTRIDFVTRQLDLLERGEVNVKTYQDFILSVQKPGDRLVADMTPANGLLSEDLLRQMAELESQPKFVLILRDPLDRLWSQMRMMGMRKSNADGASLGASVNEVIREFLDGERLGMEERSDYAGMLDRAKAAIPAERLHIVLFEDAMSADGIQALCRFVGIDASAAEVPKPVHVGKKVELDPDIRDELKRRLLPQYEAVRAHFGSLPESWIKNMATGANTEEQLRTADGPVS